MNQSKLETLLKTNNVLGAHRVGAPEGFVEVFAVPAPKLGRTVIDVVEWTTPFEHALDLSKLAYIATRIERHFDVGAQTEAYLIGLMRQITRDDVMTAIAELCDQARADRT